MLEKIQKIEGLEKIVSDLKQQGKRIVQCHGCFDIVHYGHIMHFSDAKSKGDVLIVTVTPDRFIQKGPGRPFFNEEIRLKTLASLECVDYVALNNWPTAVETIKIIKPDIYAKGKEVLGNKDVDKIEEGSVKNSNLALEEEALKSVGGRLYLTDEITFSSSNILNQITEAISEESRNYLTNLKKRFSIEDILKRLDSLRKINVIVIGDAIFDEYTYCRPMDKSGKEDLISYRFSDSEIHAGGVFAVANHLAGFAGNIDIITSIGENNQDLIDMGLNKKINRNLFIQKGKKTITKKRYMDDYKMQKLFQIYNSDELSIDEESEKKIIEYLDKNINNSDLVVVSDFGHGMISPNIIEYLVSSDKFLTVNCQLNAGNLGYNFITKYKRADFISINDRELRLPFQEKKSPIGVPLDKLRQRIDVDRVYVTLGKSGSVYYEDGHHFSAPSFTKQPLDTTGSGDAVFSLTSLLAYKDVEAELLPFLGNVMGGLAVKIIGNQRPVDPAELTKFVSYILR